MRAAVPTASTEPPAPSPRAKRRALLALGASLAPRGAMVKIALGVAAITVLAFAGIALALARGDEATPPLSQLATLASSALAWGAGLLVAVPASAQALRRDRATGVRAMLRARGVPVAVYARGRVLGLAVVLALVVAGGTIACGLFALLAAARLGEAAHVARATLGSALYALAFAGVVAPLAMAALGARSRAGGYVVLLAILVVPELAEPWTRAIAPEAIGDVLGVPAALASLRASVSAPLDVARLARAACVLAALAAVCFAMVRAEIARVDAEPEEQP
jgi:hypothetical protein